MQTMYDIRQILKGFGVFVYTGNRLGDLELIEDEIRDLFKRNLITKEEFRTCILIIRQEKLQLM